ncbi:methyltransferase domain-containing protein [Falsiroseomonas oryzae]|uniref:methyltransferase domain-containing protein n=1 Tax=Falsiroseomonas oryzae TaxID=2766473 RepID=UPI0022EA18E5|nr:methyltransferase domain-containing protein [Roseomonas sp. MO-31]
MSGTAMHGFRDVDAARDPGEFIRYLQQVTEAPHMRARSEERLRRSAIVPGMTVADLGCGLGGDTLLLARQVAPGGGRAIGLDRSAAMIGFARGRPDGAGLPVEFREADISTLPFADASLDACWMERVLIHVADPEAVLREILRALRPGGQAVLQEYDYRTLVFDAPDREVSEMVAAEFRNALRHLVIGLELPRLCRTLGFSRVEVVPGLLPMPSFAWTSEAGRWREHLAALVDGGRLDEARAAAWWRSMQEADAAGAMLCSLTGFAVYATR